MRLVYIEVSRCELCLFCSTPCSVTPQKVSFKIRKGASHFYDKKQKQEIALYTFTTLISCPDILAPKFRQIYLQSFEFCIARSVYTAVANIFD